MHPEQSKQIAMNTAALCEQPLNLFINSLTCLSQISRPELKKRTIGTRFLHQHGKLFDVSQIIKYEKPSDVTESLGKYSTLARTSKNLGPETSFDSLSVEYDTFAKRVKEIAPQFLYDPRSQGQEKEASKSVKVDYPPRYLQTELYTKILETPALNKDIPNALHLSLTAMCRTSCEAVVEGMGSVMKRHLKNRKSLD